MPGPCISIIGDIEPDSNYSCSDLIVFLETKLQPSDLNDNYALPGFHLHRFDCQSAGRTRSAFGIAVYSKQEIPDTAFCHRTRTTSAGTVIEMVLFNIETNLSPVSTAKVLAVYSSPKAKWTELKSFLQEARQLYMTNDDTPVILAGDFNVDLLANPTHNILQTIGFQQYIHQSTTDNNTLLDHIYVSETQASVTCGVLESHFSDHKPVFIVFH